MNISEELKGLFFHTWYDNIWRFGFECFKTWAKKEKKMVGVFEKLAVFKLLFHYRLSK